MLAEIIVAFQPVLHGFSGVGHCETSRIIRSTVREIGEQTSAELSAARPPDSRFGERPRDIQKIPAGRIWRGGVSTGNRCFT